MMSCECGMVKVEHHCQHSSGYVAVLETTKSIHGRAPKVTNENLFAFLQIINAAVSHYTQMNVVH